MMMMMMMINRSILQELVIYTDMLELESLREDNRRNSFYLILLST